MEHTAKLVEDARYSEALEIRWERPVCPQVSQVSERPDRAGKRPSGG
jgi:hypothetical protein